MKVLFLTLAYPENGQRNIYTDLMDEFSRRGDQVYIACQREKRLGKETTFAPEKSVNVLRIKTGNITKTNMIEKGVSTLTLENYFLSAIKRYFSDISFDMVIYSTPPITFEKVVKYIKDRDGAYAYLLLKDIFPQNAVDLGLIKKSGLIYKYFRHKEKSLYQMSDKIGCMSKANVDYVLAHNDIREDIVEISPNSIAPVDLSIDEETKDYIINKYNIPKDKTIFIYGGNLGKPQGIDFLLKTLEIFENEKKAFLFIVGSGTEFAKIEVFIDEKKFKNVKLLSSMIKKDYDNLLSICDVGLIYLDERFTIPNFPSRVTAYMEASIPTMAITDEVTDIRNMLLENKLGVWSKSGDLDAFKRNIRILLDDVDNRMNMGKRSNEYLYSNFDVKDSYNIITKNLERRVLDV